MGVTRQSWGDITLHYTQANIVIKRDSRDPLFSELPKINVQHKDKTFKSAILEIHPEKIKKSFSNFVVDIYQSAFYWSLLDHLCCSEKLSKKRP